MLEERRTTSQRIALSLVLSGIAARLALACISWGTADANTWQEFGRRICEHGILALYHTDAGFNHPPLAGYFAALTYFIANATGISFSLLFKLPSIAADAITCAM